MPFPPLSQWRKWLMMISGSSVQHAPQGPGTVYARNGLRGYYNDLRHKFTGTRGRHELDGNGLPVNRLAGGETVYFPTTIAQYGLGAYDVYLSTGDQAARKAFLSCAEWMCGEQDTRGGWDTWHRLGIAGSIPYSAMAQGEGASLLYRAARETSSPAFRRCADLAVDCMLTPVEKGGPARRTEDRLVLEERVAEPASAVLNGWIFAVFGLHDAVLAAGEPAWQRDLALTLRTLAGDLPGYDTGYWSAYDRLGRLASPFYHSLHIAQLAVLAELTGLEIFDAAAGRWRAYESHSFNRCRAFAVKAWQKLREPGEVVIVK